MTEFDCIQLLGITEYSNHGVYDYERKEQHPFRADVHLFVDTQAAGGSDQLTDTVNYQDIEAAVRAILAGDARNLLENIAEEIAVAALRAADPRGLAVRVRIHKPEAPLTGELDDTAVTIWRGAVLEGPGADEFLRVAMESVTLDERIDAEVAANNAASQAKAPTSPAYTQPLKVTLALGANLGDRLATMRRAVATLERLDTVEVIGVSPLVETAAVVKPGAAAQPNYLNAVVQVRTELSLMELLRSTQGIEAAFGRVRNEVWAPRTLDIDILAAVDAHEKPVTSTLLELQVPHPAARERAFVLVPWSYLDGAAYLGHDTVAELAQVAPDQKGILRIWQKWVDADTSVTLTDEAVARTPAQAAVRQEAQPQAGVAQGTQPQAEAAAVQARPQRRSVSARRKSAAGPTETTGMLPRRVTRAQERAARRAAQQQRAAQQAAQEQSAAATQSGQTAASPAQTQPQAPQRRSIYNRQGAVAPSPEDERFSAAEGAELTESTTQLRRRMVTARPTTTGFIPVVKHETPEELDGK